MKLLYLDNCLLRPKPIALCYVIHVQRCWQYFT